MRPCGGDWRRCQGGCGYEITEGAHDLYRELVEAFESDPAKFFTAVERRRDDLRDLEPVWQRSLR